MLYQRSDQGFLPGFFLKTTYAVLTVDSFPIVPSSNCPGSGLGGPGGGFGGAVFFSNGTSSGLPLLLPVLKPPLGGPKP